MQISPCPPQTQKAWGFRILAKKKKRTTCSESVSRSVPLFRHYRQWPYIYMSRKIWASGLHFPHPRNYSKYYPVPTHLTPFEGHFSNNRSKRDFTSCFYSIPETRRKCFIVTSMSTTIRLPDHFTPLKKHSTVQIHR